MGRILNGLKLLIFMVGERNDPYTKYRDGKMNFEIEELEED